MGHVDIALRGAAGVEFMFGARFGLLWRNLSRAGAWAQDDQGAAEGRHQVLGLG